MIIIAEDKSEYPKTLLWDELTDIQKCQASWALDRVDRDIIHDIYFDAVGQAYQDGVTELLEKYDLDLDLSADDFKYEVSLLNTVNKKYGIRKLDEVFSEKLDALDEYVDMSVNFSYNTDKTIRVLFNDYYEKVDDAVAELKKFFSRRIVSYVGDDERQSAEEELDSILLKLSRKAKVYAKTVSGFLTDLDALQERIHGQRPVSEYVYDWLSDKNYGYVVIPDRESGKDEVIYITDEHGNRLEIWR